MQNTNAQQSEINNFYAEKPIAGAYPLNLKHLNAINEAFPDQKEFIAGVVKQLTWQGLVVPACLVANFALLKDMYDNGMFGVYSKVNINAVEMNFSFIKKNEDGSYNRFETRAQQILRNSYLVFNMGSPTMSRFKKFLAGYDLAVTSLHGCGCCIVPLNKLEELENSKPYNLNSNMRMEANTLGTNTSLITPYSLEKVDAYITEADIYAITKLDDIVSSLMHIDNFSPDPVVVVDGSQKDAASIMELYYS